MSTRRGGVTRKPTHQVRARGVRRRVALLLSRSCVTASIALHRAGLPMPPPRHAAPLTPISTPAAVPPPPSE